VNTEPELNLARTMKRPVVNLSALCARPDCQVMVDKSVGAVAAEHLLECGLRRFGYYAYAVSGFPANDAEDLLTTHREGCECSTFLAPGNVITPPPDNWIHQLEQWIKSLTLPVGIMACLDGAGQHGC